MASPRDAAVFFALLLLVLLLQFASGAYHSEFSGYPDEPAHYVTSLMVREYLTGPHPISPTQFAQNYYDHYPKVAFGHWPPLLYVVQALWMLLFSCSRTSVLLELALTTALLAYFVYSEARRWFGSNAGILAGFLTVCLPLVQTYTSEEMSETLLVLMCYLSALSFARYLDSESWKDNLWFGVFFSLAVLTKGSGWLLALVPPIAMLLTRKLRLLLRPSFWVSIAIIVVSCLPWQLMTLHLAEQGWAGGTQPSFQYTFTALGQFLVILGQITGPVLCLLIAIGIATQVVIPVFRRTVASSPAVMAAFILSVWIFHSVVPAGVEDRKMIIAVPALILFLFAGGFWVADRLPRKGWLAPWRNAFVAGVVGIIFCVETFAIPRQEYFGYDEAARLITSNTALQSATILVSSGSVGEGLLIAEVAMQQPRPRAIILRATKALAHVDWNASKYQSLFSNPADVIGYLARSNIQFVVVDTFPPRNQFLHDELLKKAIRSSAQFRLMATFPSASPAEPGQIRLYRFSAATRSRGTE